MFCMKGPLIIIPCMCYCHCPQTCAVVHNEILWCTHVRNYDCTCIYQYAIHYHYPFKTNSCIHTVASIPTCWIDHRQQ